MTHMTIWRMRVACRITNTADTHSEYLIFIDLPQQQRSRERVPILYVHYLSLSDLKAGPFLSLPKDRWNLAFSWYRFEKGEFGIQVRSVSCTATFAIRRSDSCQQTCALFALPSHAQERLFISCYVTTTCISDTI
jgi:hypothetical protein